MQLYALPSAWQHGIGTEPPFSKSWIRHWSTIHLRACKQFTHHQVQKRAQSVAAIHLQSCDGRTVDPRVREQVTLAQPCRRNWTSTVSPVTIGVSPVKHTSPSAAQRSHDKFEDKNKNYVSFRSKFCTNSRICNKMHSTQ